MKIRNVEFDFDIFRAADADRFDRAVKDMQAAAQRLEREKAALSSLGDIIRAQCAVLDDFLAQVLGEDYDECLHLDAENLRQVRGLYYELLDRVDADRRDLEQSRYPQPRAQAAPALPAPPAVPELSAQQAAEPPAPNTAVFPPRPAAETPPPDFAHMNRAQRRAAVRAMKGRP